MFRALVLRRKAGITSGGLGAALLAIHSFAVHVESYSDIRSVSEPGRLKVEVQQGHSELCFQIGRSCVRIAILARDRLPVTHLYLSILAPKFGEFSIRIGRHVPELRTRYHIHEQRAQLSRERSSAGNQEKARSLKRVIPPVEAVLSE